MLQKFTYSEKETLAQQHYDNIEEQEYLKNLLYNKQVNKQVTYIKKLTERN